MTARISAHGRDCLRAVPALLLAAVIGTVSGLVPVAVSSTLVLAVYAAALRVAPVAAFALLTLTLSPLASLVDDAVLLPGSEMQINAIGALRILTVAVVVTLLIVRRGRRHSDAHGRLAPTAIALGLWLLLLTVIAPDRILALRTWILPGEAIAIYLYTVSVVRTWRHIQLIAWTATLGAVIPILVGFLQAANVLPLRDVEGNPITRINSLGHHPNEYAAYLVAIAFIVLFLWGVTSRPVGWRLFLWGELVATIASIFLTFTRIAWVGLLGGLVVFVVAKSRSTRALIMLLACGLPLVASPNVFGVIMERAAQDGSIAQHLRIDDYLFQAFLAQPFGRGLGTAPAIILRTEGIVSFAHNDYLGLLVEGGFVGLALYTAVLAAAAWHLISAIRRLQRDDPARELQIAVLALLAGYAVIGLSDGAQSYLGVWLFMFVGLAEAAARMSRIQDAVSARGIVTSRRAVDRFGDLGAGLPAQTAAPSARVRHART